MNFLHEMLSIMPVVREDTRPNASSTLAEQIGFSASDRLLIVKCDDLGSSRSANSAIEAGLREGFATSASVMMPAPCAQAAAAQCSDLDIGVHLTLTSEYPTYRWRSLTGAPSLHDRNGFLPRTVEEVLAQAKLDDIERECRAQVELALAWGIDVTHLDCHMDILQLNRRYFEVYMRLAEHFRLPARVQRLGAGLPFLRLLRPNQAKPGIVAPDRLEAPPWGEPARPALMKCIRSGRKGVTEFALHPVTASEELYAYDTENAEERVADAECLMDPSLKHFIAASGITLIGFRPLREVMRRQLRC